MKHDNRLFTRRHLLKATALGVGAVALGGPLVMRGRAASTGANSKINLALVGCGGQGRGDLSGMIAAGGVNAVALCDPDPEQLKQVHDIVARHGAAEPKGYEDYRRLLDDASSFDAVLIATPDHWHAPLCKAFLQAGKHVYCEKPLGHSVAETSELRELARHSKVATQMGNQGSASPSLRRCVEVIQAGVVGPIREIYQWGIYCARPGDGIPPGEDPVPSGFNWDLWVGPSPLRPFKKDIYHPKNWRGWFDFGNGSLADFWCHAANLPVRALDLGYPERLVMNLREHGQNAPGKAAMEFHFPARGDLPPVILYWMGNHQPPASVLASVVAVHRGDDGVLILGEKGCIHTDHWGFSGLLHLNGEPRMKDVLLHPAVKGIPPSLPRTKGHAQEWLDACRGEGRAFSDFDTGGKLTEIGLAGCVAMRVGKDLQWDGEKMEARNAPEAARFVHPEYREKWLS